MRTAPEWLPTCWEIAEWMAASEIDRVWDDAPESGAS
jgi:hypothetical protein